MTTDTEYRTVDELGNGTLQVWDLPTDTDTLLSIIKDVFTDHWRQIGFGVIVQGAAWEVAAPNAPRKIAMYDGYVTVDFGAWHFHLCIGEHTASGPELGRIRRCARAELYRRVGPDGAPVSWGLRLFNAIGEQMMTVLLPNPFLTDTQELRAAPDFSRLAAWDHLRRRYLGLDPDPHDRSGTGFRHG
ncbi:hypothetical protein Ga0074812_10938 [Parafrankia irregularis]|uniref:Uncharacterized protein n=1 Tax=Parafrankia irregularis TaxID=795642 RepID=A0A0S4QP67_9ACTN|nr:MULTISPECIES: hypothetical protein [Parafrankia]MBE3200490.1 hypothetical protein [Parafrankia sp. CH37]CUU56818.1 hypothetical protein Ga0074812_10938 [Parafrankia irregularis]